MERKRVAVVTGAASGIGEAIACGFGEEGYVPVVLDIHEPQRSELRDGPGRWIQADVGNEESVAAAFAVIERRFGRVDALVNCAGIDARGALVETDLLTWSDVIRVNLTGTFLCSREAARVMTQQGAGVIICISSINGLLGWKRCAAYSASKGGVDAFVRAAAAELGESGIRVVSVAPGAIETPIWAADLTPEVRAMMSERAALGYVGIPRDVADVVIFLASDAARYVTGIVVPVCGGRATIDYLPHAL